MLGSFYSAELIVQVMLLGKIQFLKSYPLLQAYHDRLEAQPSFKKADSNQTHNVHPHLNVAKINGASTNHLMNIEDACSLIQGSTVVPMSRRTKLHTNCYVH